MPRPPRVPGSYVPPLRSSPPLPSRSPRPGTVPVGHVGTTGVYLLLTEMSAVQRKQAFVMAARRAKTAGSPTTLAYLVHEVSRFCVDPAGRVVDLEYRDGSTLLTRRAIRLRTLADPAVHFTRDNTHNHYTDAALADLNAAYSVRLAELRCQGVDVDSRTSAAGGRRGGVARMVVADHQRGRRAAAATAARLLTDAAADLLAALQLIARDDRGHMNEAAELAACRAIARAAIAKATAPTTDGEG